jgi:hypothetical protein
MSDLRTAAQQALKALEHVCDYTDAKPGYRPGVVSEALLGLRNALAQQEQEPVAWTLIETLDKRETTTTGHLWFSDPQNSAWTPLFTHPPRRTGLPHCEKSCEANAFQIEIRKLKAELKEKNA